MPGHPPTPGTIGISPTFSIPTTNIVDRTEDDDLFQDVNSGNMHHRHHKHNQNNQPDPNAQVAANAVTPPPAPPDGTVDPDSGNLSFTGTETSGAADTLAHYIASNPYAYSKLAKSYGSPPAKTHEEAIAQAVFLAQHHTDFSSRFEKEVSQSRHFNFGRMFLAICTGGASEIAIRIAQAAKKAKAARQAAAAQQQAAGQASTPAAVVADPVAAVAAAPTDAAAQAAGAQSQALHAGCPGPSGPGTPSMTAQNKNLIIGGIVFVAFVIVGIIAFILSTGKKEAKA